MSIMTTTKELRQYTITATKTFTYYKTVHATDIVDAHVKAHEPVEDMLDDWTCLLYTSPSPRDVEESRMPSSA